MFVPSAPLRANMFPPANPNNCLARSSHAHILAPRSPYIILQWLTSPLHVFEALRWGPRHSQSDSMCFYWAAGGGCLCWNSSGNRETCVMFIFSFLMGPSGSHYVTRHVRFLSGNPMLQPKDLTASWPPPHPTPSHLNNPPTPDFDSAQRLLLLPPDVDEKHDLIHFSLLFFSNKLL